MYDGATMSVRKVGTRVSEQEQDPSGEMSLTAVEARCQRLGSYLGKDIFEGAPPLLCHLFKDG